MTDTGSLPWVSWRHAVPLHSTGATDPAFGVLDQQTQAGVRYVLCYVRVEAWKPSCVENKGES